MTASHPTAARRPRRRSVGFTLIELLVTISIIVLLVSISVPVALKMLGSADTSQTQALLNGLAAAADHYNVTTDSTVDHTLGKDAFGNNVNLYVGDDDFTIDSNLDGNNDDDMTLAYFVYTAGQVPKTAKLIAIAAKDDLTFDDPRLSPPLLIEPFGVRPMLNIADDLAFLATLLPDTIDSKLPRIELLDNWDNKIRYAGPVKHTQSSDPTDFPDDDYLPANPTAYFASAGPDGLWGRVIHGTNLPDASVDEDEDGQPDSADNIYSFDTN